MVELTYECLSCNLWLNLEVAESDGRRVCHFEIFAPPARRRKGGKKAVCILRGALTGIKYDKSKPKSKKGRLKKLKSEFDDNPFAMASIQKELKAIRSISRTEKIRIYVAHGNMFLIVRAEVLSSSGIVSSVNELQIQIRPRLIGNLFHAVQHGSWMATL